MEPDISYYVHKNPPFAVILSQFNPIHNLIIYLF
jgi:hypothetical protein